MNISINRQVVFSISILLTVMLLPTTTLAHDNSKTSDLTWTNMTPVSNCTHWHDILSATPGPQNSTEEKSPGFSETDPSEQLFVGVVAIGQTSGQQASAGFAETDPANYRTREDWTVLQTSRNQVQQIHIGFDESDPSVNSDQLYCLDANTERKPVQISRVFSFGNVQGQ